MNIRINEEIFNLYGELHIGVLICNDITNYKEDADTQALLDENIELCRQKLSDLENLTDLRVVKEWREAYKKFGEKKNRSSIEALLRRIYNNKDISCINPLVDIYNAMSIKYQLPCGGEDIDSMEGDMELAVSDGKEVFIPFGSDEEEYPKEKEIIYKCGNSVVCRCFNWREADFSKLTDETKNAVLVMECLSSEALDTLNQALDEMRELIEDLLGGDCKKYILNQDNPELSKGRE